LILPAFQATTIVKNTMKDHQSDTVAIWPAPGSNFPEQRNGAEVTGFGQRAGICAVFTTGGSDARRTIAITSDETK